MARLYMLLIGCLPANRNVEQHDVFFGIGESIKEVVEQAIAFWPEAGDSLHIDAWRQVNNVDGYGVEVIDYKAWQDEQQLYFINLGGYKPNEFEEFHYKMLTVATDKNEALKTAKQSAFFKHSGTTSAHIDEKYGIDVDNMYSIKDILPAACKKRYNIKISDPQQTLAEDPIQLGYFKPEKVHVWGEGF